MDYKPRIRFFCDAHHRFQATNHSHLGRSHQTQHQRPQNATIGLRLGWRQRPWLRRVRGKTRKAPVFTEEPHSTSYVLSAYCLGGGRFIYPILIFMCFILTKSAMTNTFDILFEGGAYLLPCCYVICVQVDERDVRVLGKYGKLSHVGRMFGSACDNHIPHFGTKPYYPLLSHIFL